MSQLASKVSVVRICIAIFTLCALGANWTMWRKLRETQGMHAESKKDLDAQQARFDKVNLARKKYKEATRLNVMTQRRLETLIRELNRAGMNAQLQDVVQSCQSSDIVLLKARSDPNLRYWLRAPDDKHSLVILVSTKQQAAPGEVPPALPTKTLSQIQEMSVAQHFENLPQFATERVFALEAGRAHMLDFKVARLRDASNQNGSGTHIVITCDDSILFDASYPRRVQTESTVYGVSRRISGILKPGLIDAYWAQNPRKELRSTAEGVWLEFGSTDLVLTDSANDQNSTLQFRFLLKTSGEVLGARTQKTALESQFHIDWDADSAMYRILGLR